MSPREITRPSSVKSSTILPPTLNEMRTLSPSMVPETLSVPARIRSARRTMQTSATTAHTTATTAAAATRRCARAKAAASLSSFSILSRIRSLLGPLSTPPRAYGPAALSPIALSRAARAIRYS